MKESNKQRSAKRAGAKTSVYADYGSEAERGDFKRRKLTVFTGYTIFVVIFVLVML